MQEIFNCVNLLGMRNLPLVPNGHLLVEKKTCLDLGKFDVQKLIFLNNTTSYPTNTLLCCAPLEDFYTVNLRDRLGSIPAGGPRFQS